MLIIRKPSLNGEPNHDCCYCSAVTFIWQEGNAKVQTFGKRCQSAKRDPNCPVVIRGWLNKKVLLLLTVSNFMSNKKAAWLTRNPFTRMQDSAGLKLWKRRWFVLSNYCLFYYKGNANCRSALGFSQILLRQHSSWPVAVFLFVSLFGCFLITSDSREESVLGSIPLPSYKILFCTPRECKNRKFTFKVSM